jgi:hypothetical protein
MRVLVVEYPPSVTIHYTEHKSPPQAEMVRIIYCHLKVPNEVPPEPVVMSFLRLLMVTGPDAEASDFGKGNSLTNKKLRSRI